MQANRPSLFARDDTFLGVCEALGEDFGFNPLWLRITLGVLLLWNPVVVLATYVGLGVIVLASRLIYPDPRPAKIREGAPAAQEASENDDEARRELAAA